MDPSRLTRGSMLAGLGAIIVLIGLFLLPWYKVDEAKLAPLQISANLYAQATTTAPTTTTPTAPTTPGQTTTPAVPTIPDVTVNAPPAHFGAWRGQGFLGTLANFVILAAAIVALALALLAAAGESHPIGEPGRVITGLGVAALVMLILRMFFPVEEIAGFEFDAGLKYGIFITLIGTLMVIAGGLLQQQEEVPTPTRRARPPGPPPPPGEPPPEAPLPPSEQPPPPPESDEPAPPPAGPAA